VRFRDVVLCDNPGCGAILRLGGYTSISVVLDHDAMGHFFCCPRCSARTSVTIDGTERVTPRQGADAKKRRRADSI